MAWGALKVGRACASSNPPCSNKSESVDVCMSNLSRLQARCYEAAINYWRRLRSQPAGACHGSVTLPVLQSISYGPQVAAQTTVQWCPEHMGEYWHTLSNPGGMSPLPFAAHFADQEWCVVRGLVVKGL